MKTRVVLLILLVAILLIVAPVAAKATTPNQDWICWEGQTCHIRVRPGSTTWIRADCESAEFVKYGDSWMFVCN